MNIKLAVFDMAGTTVRDFDNVHEALMEALGFYDINVSRDEVNKVMGMPKPLAIRVLLTKELPASQITDELLSQVYSRFEAIMVDFYKTDPLVTEKEGAEKLFRYLKSKGISVGIDTGFNRIIADTIMERLGWKDKQLIDFSVTSDEVPDGRPHPDMIFKAMDFFHISDPQEVIKIGDTASDMEEGRNAGCRYIIGITTGAFTVEELRHTPHTHLVSHLSEIPAIIGL
ncbi:MAG: HAD-IA family hydrolase [Cyclobacteriaceae bacterium]|nr:HAD-IA family hydrolase [Cyclobacteriaceae bacterium]